MQRTTDVLTWAWKSQPDLQELTQMIREVTGASFYLTDADTGSDQFAVVVTREPVTEAEANAVYQAWEADEAA